MAEERLDVLFVNPPSPDGEVFIRDIHRVGRRSREKMIWPQTELAQLAASVYPKYSVKIIDCIAEYMTWPQFQKELERLHPRYLVTNVTAPTLTNDFQTTFLAKPMGTKTIAIGSHVTPTAFETLTNFPTLDYICRHEPDETLPELIETVDAGGDLFGVKSLAFRAPDTGEIIINPDRPFIHDLDQLPIPLYHLLPLEKYKIPMLKGSYCFVTTGRGCPAGCRFCIKHVMWQSSMRSHSAERILEEVRVLFNLGVKNVHFYADLFTADRDVVMKLCDLIIASGMKFKWTCNSRVDFVDEEMLTKMHAAGCWLISWGLESANQQVLQHNRKGITVEKTRATLLKAKSLGIRNWGYFIIGLPGETEASIRETIDFSKNLPLHIALFHIAVPYPGTPMYHEIVENDWITMTKYEDFDMDRSTVINYPGLSHEQLEKWAKRAFREWAMRPGPALTFLRSANSIGTLKSLFSIGVEHLSWVKGV